MDEKQKFVENRGDKPSRVTYASMFSTDENDIESRSQTPSIPQHKGLQQKQAHASHPQMVFLPHKLNFMLPWTVKLSETHPCT